MKLKTIKDLKPDTRNANKGTDRGRKLIAESLSKYGAGRSILVDREGRVIAGNKTLEAASKNGHRKIRVVPTDGSEIVVVQRTDLDLNSANARELAIADNRSSELDLEWNPDVLKDLDVDLSQFWNENELRKLVPGPEIEAPEPQLDKAAELQKKWKTARGQIWEIGEHRIWCANSFDDWTPLIGSNKISLALTDPPYGVDVDYGEVIDDAATVEAIVSKILPRLRAFPVVLLTSGHRMLWSYPRADWVLAWVHPAGMGRCPWGFLGFNPILAYGACPYLKSGKGSMPDSLVLATDRKGVEGHPTPKPIEVWKWMLKRGTANEKEIVFDPFLGSGTTAVAAQTLNRVCVGIELEPKYVAVSLERLFEMGLKPKLLK